MRLIQEAHVPTTMPVNPPHSPIATEILPKSLTAEQLTGMRHADLMSLYDTLETVRADELHGLWRGQEVSEDHMLSGLLPVFGWHGKRFDGTESVHPLIFDSVGGGMFSVNPGWVPMRLGPWVPRWKLGRWLMTIARPLVGTRKPHARLREIQYRGKVSAAMVYDQLPIIDVFRRIDDFTLLGAMDYRRSPTPFLFLLIQERAEMNMVSMGQAC